jgi:hypothetical protein
MSRRKLTQEEAISRFKNVHTHGRYLYDNVKYKDAHSKVKITCVAHGEFEQTPASHMNGQGCYECYHKIKKHENNKAKFTTSVFINHATNVHGNKYDYSKTAYVNNGKGPCYGKYIINKISKV